MAQEVPKKLSDTNFKVSELVLYSSDKHSTGGVIYQIVEDNEPVVISSRTRTVKRNVSEWDHANQKYVSVMREVNLYGQWDAQGKQISYKIQTVTFASSQSLNSSRLSKERSPRGKERHSSFTTATSLAC